MPDPTFGEAESTQVFEFRLMTAKPIRMAMARMQMLQKPNDPALMDQVMKYVNTQAEKEIVKKGGDVAYPSWEDLRAESREEDPAILLTVTDEEDVGVLPQGGAQRSLVAGLDQRRLDAQPAEEPPDELPRAAVAVAGEYDVIARFEHGEQRGRHRRHAAGEQRARSQKCRSGSSPNRRA